MLLVEAFGPHSGRSDDVLTRLRLIFTELPDDRGHAKIEVRQCCSDCAYEGRLTISRKAFRDELYRVSSG
jgi:hypothetical protein